MLKRVLFGCIAVALVGGAGVWFTGRDQVTPAQAQEEKTAASRPPVEVAVFTVKSSELTLTQDLSGRTSAYQVAEIRPQVSGIILKRLFKEGSIVKKGQQLYQIDPATYQATYDSAAAGLEEARANLQSVAPKAERYTKLVKMGGVSRQEYDDTVAQLAQAKASVAVAQATLATAKINLDYTKVFAPITGRIGRSSVTEGALVTANQTTALATIQNLSQIYVDVNQSSEDLMKLRRHMKNQDHSPKAQLFIGNDTNPYPQEGTVLFSDVTVDQGTGMVQLRILFPNPEYDLLPGLFVRARVEQVKKENAITVPQQSVIRKADGSTYAWVVDPTGKVNTRPVIVSQVVGNQWLVTDGLAVGDRIVVEGLQKISPNAQVTPVEMTSTNRQ